MTVTSESNLEADIFEKNPDSQARPGTSRQNGALVPRIGLTMIRVETLKMEQNAGSENIRLSVSLRFHTMGLVPAYCGETRNRARPKTELLLSQKRIPAADFVSMQC